MKRANSTQAFSQFVGVDLGGGRGKTTALAVLRPRQGDGLPLRIERLEPRRGGEPLYDDALLAGLTALGADALVAIDAPLSLPACVRCQVPVCPGQAACVDPAVNVMRRLTAALPGTRDARRGKPAFTPYTQRVSEVYLQHQRGLAPRETLGQGMGPLTARGMYVRRALAATHALDRNLIEVYPKATVRWLPQLAQLRAESAAELSRRYKKHVDERETRVRILDRLSPLVEFAPGIWREECVRSDHHFDAVICALTGYLWATEAWQVPEAARDCPAEDGWIWTPPTPEGEGAERGQPVDEPGHETPRTAKSGALPRPAALN